METVEAVTPFVRVVGRQRARNDARAVIGYEAANLERVVGRRPGAAPSTDLCWIIDIAFEAASPNIFAAGAFGEHDTVRGAVGDQLNRVVATSSSTSVNAAGRFELEVLFIADCVMSNRKCVSIHAGRIVSICKKYHFSRRT